jgi:hypothetical protein
MIVRNAGTYCRHFEKRAHPEFFPWGWGLTLRPYIYTVCLILKIVIKITS